MNSYKLDYTLGIDQQKTLSALAKRCREVNGWSEQKLEILIDNAVNYSPPGSEIQLGADVKKNIFSFYVIDHGGGIKDEDKPFIYDRFYCADKSRTQRDHYGLGLSIARELAEMHGGSIGLSDTPGGGCTFRVSFPL